jgi:hypothetical protein
MEFTEGVFIMRVFVSLLIAIGLIFSTASAQDKPVNSKRLSKNISGHYILRYSNVSNRLDVLLLKSNQIKFHLIALLNTGSDSPHNGEIKDTIELKGNIAVYEAGKCKITLKFIDNKVQITESNVDDCGFGAFVTAKGTYIKRSVKPIFIH